MCTFNQMLQFHQKVAIQQLKFPILGEGAPGVQLGFRGSKTQSFCITTQQSEFSTKTTYPLKIKFKRNHHIYLSPVAQISEN